jgi:hypothetical protein
MSPPNFGEGKGSNLLKPASPVENFFNADNEFAEAHLELKIRQLMGPGKQAG